MSLQPIRTIVLGSDLPDAHRICQALDLPPTAARSVRTAVHSLRGYGSGTRVLITSRCSAILNGPASMATAQTAHALAVIQSTGGQVFTL